MGSSQSWSSATFKMDVPFMSKLVDIYIAEIHAIGHVFGLLPSLIMQIITREEILAFQRNGSNALGITDEDGPLLRRFPILGKSHTEYFEVINSAIRWNNPEDDNTVKDAGNKVIGKALNLAKEMGVYHRFIYQNYANQTQDVFAGYGGNNMEKLRQIQRKYDPEGLFTRLQPGSFKL